MDPRLASLVFTGFGDRLLSEVKKLAPKDVKIKVRLWRVPVGHGGAGQPDLGGEAHVASRGPLISSPAAPPTHLLPLLPADALAVWPQAQWESPSRLGQGLLGGDRQLHCRLLPLDLGPSGTAVLHVDWVRQGSRGGLGEETILPWTLLLGLAQTRWRWVDFPPN